MKSIYPVVGGVLVVILILCAITMVFVSHGTNPLNGIFSASSTPLNTFLNASTSSSTTFGGEIGTQRLTVKGATIYTPSGAPIVFRGYSWGNWGTAQQQDAADNVSQGANSVRIPLSWYFGDGSQATTCGTSAGKSSQDSYDPSAPGFINPANLAMVDQQVQWATSQHLWVDLMVRGGDCDFWSNPKIIPQFIQMWAFLAQHYKNTPYMGAYELLSEPHPTKKFTNTDVRNFYEKVIASVRTVDPAIPVIIGPATDYAIRNLEQIYIPNGTNIIYTANFYELPAYVKEIKGTGPQGGYPGSYQDQGNSTNSCVYPGRGQVVTMDKTFLAGLISCATNFGTEHTVPIFINQVGIRSGTPNSLQYIQDVLDIFHSHNIGFAYWTYRSPERNGLGADDIGIMYQTSSNGPYALKTNWSTVISVFLRGGTTE